MQWHIETDLVALLMNTVIFLAMRDGFDKSKNRDLRFSICVWINFLAIAVDVVASVVYDFPVSAGFFRFTQTLYHATNLLTIISWFHYTVAVIFEDDPRIIHRTDCISAILYALYLVYVVSNLFTGAIFTYSEQAGYARGPLFLLPVIVFILYSLFTLVFALFRGRRIATRRLQTALVCVPVLLAVGIVLQLSFSGWLTIFPCYTAGLLIAFLTIQQNRTEIVFKDLSAAAAHDVLTGISNRDYAERTIANFLANMKSHDCALVILDLDNFKSINDNFGHVVGDEALKSIGRYLSAFFRGSDIVARYGGDEFLAFLPDMGDRAILQRRLSQLVVGVSRIKLADSPDVHLSCSAGVALGRSGETDILTLLRRADAALYDVKRNGKNDFAFFSEQMDVPATGHNRVDTLTLKHTDWFDSDELKRLLYALSDYLPYIASVNLVKNEYYAMEIASEMTDSLPAYGSYDSLLSSADEVFHPADWKRVRPDFSLLKLTEIYAGAERCIAREVRHRSHDGHWRWAQIVCLFGPIDEHGDPHAYLIVRPFDDAHNEATERLRLNKVFELAMQAAFEYFCLLDTTDGSCTMYGNDGLNSHGVPNRGDFNEIARQIRDALIPEHERAAFDKNANMERIEREMRTHGKYRYRYRANDGVREVSFYYYEPTKTGLLMAVQKKA